MITDEQIDSLPDDNDIAFVQYEAILRESAQKVINQSNWGGEREYVTYVLAFLDTRPISGSIPNKPPLDDGQFSDWYRNHLLPAVDQFKAVVRLQRSIRQKANVSILRLSKDYKTQIGGHLTAIRKIVVEAELTENKRDAIFRRINNLQEEVDRDRTRTETSLTPRPYRCNAQSRAWPRRPASSAARKTPARNARPRRRRRTR